MVTARVSTVVWMVHTCQMQCMLFLHSASVWQSCADPTVDCAPPSGVGVHGSPVWHVEPADARPAELFANPQQTLPLGQSLS